MEYVNDKSLHKSYLEYLQIFYIVCVSLRKCKQLQSFVFYSISF